MLDKITTKQRKGSKMVKSQKTVHIDRDVAQMVRIAAAIADCSFSEMIETLVVEALADRVKKEAGK